MLDVKASFAHNQTATGKICGHQSFRPAAGGAKIRVNRISKAMILLSSLAHISYLSVSSVCQLRFGQKSI